MIYSFWIASVRVAIRYFLLTSLVIVVVQTCSFAQASASKKSSGTSVKKQQDAASNGPSLEETTKWLTRTIHELGGHTEPYERENAQTFSVTYPSISFVESCYLSYDERAEFLDAKKEPTSRPYIGTYSVMLQDLDASTIKISEEKPSEQVKFQRLFVSTNKNKLLVHGAGDVISDKRAGISIDFADADLAERASKAFAHAIDLCKKNNPEPF